MKILLVMLVALSLNGFAQQQQQAPQGQGQPRQEAPSQHQGESTGLSANMAYSVCINDGFSEEQCLEVGAGYLDCRKGKSKSEFVDCLKVEESE